MQYNPDISVSENARNNNVSEAAVRKYIKVHKIDRRHDEKAKKYALIQKLREEHPEWSARAIAKELNIAPATVCSYINGTSTDTLPEKKSARQANECLIFDTNKPIDFLRMERYDCSLIKVVAFSKGTFCHNGYSIGFSNMLKYPFDFMGQRFQSVEAAYVACNYGKNNKDCIRIQKEIQALDNGWDCKKLYRNNEIDEQHGRKDFHHSMWHFHLMLYLVWEKCKQHPEFCEMLLAIPDNVAIIENQSRMNKVLVGDWGCKNNAARKAYYKKLDELERKKVKRREEKATILSMNTGVWEGMNHQGKILMACRKALRDGSEPYIDYDVLNDAKIYLFGKLLTFSVHRSAAVLSDNQPLRCLTKDELFEVCTYHKEDMERPFDNKSILSNFYPFDFTVNGKKFHSTEQYYHWRRLEGYPEYQEELLLFTGERNAWDCYYYIRGKKKPKVRLDKSVKDAIEKDYEIRFAYMREALRYKVRYCKGFKEALLNTGDKIIAEKDQTYSKKDIWAVHKCSGANILGKLLMELRSEIKKQE